MSEQETLPVGVELGEWTDAELERRLETVGFCLSLTSLSRRRAELMDEASRIMREQESRGVRGV